MKRMIIVSNRLPVKISQNEKGMNVQSSSGGLATGLRSYHKSNNSVWIGWPGLSVQTAEEEQHVRDLLSTEQCLPVFLSEPEVDDFYYGFSNATIWPLFHYFTEYSKFQTRTWQSYVEVNEKFAEAVIENALEGDTVWVHDYQLLLLPSILRERRPDLRIGFFLHIPFPSFEVLRILPWRREILEGIIGADLIGFHTYDYARHFISSVKRLLGHEVNFNTVTLEKRHVYIDVFPMGIDYNKFEQMAQDVQSKPIRERSKEHQDIDRFLLSMPNRKLILSIDRLDYTKGLPERLKAFRCFLNRHPEYREQVSLVLLTVPSRVEVEQYQALKSEIEELVGSINGQFGTINWNPIIYFYRSVPFENLIELYSSADVALLTPLRDGMNLVAKEFIAAKNNHKGVLILSEMAGASRELGEAISVNPSNVEEVAEAIFKALNEPVEKQQKDIMAMQQRLKRYDVHKWAAEFMNALQKTSDKQAEYQTRKVSARLQNNFAQAFVSAKKKALFLDYDGTLQRFYDHPKEAVPDSEIYVLLDELAKRSDTDLVLISGRDKNTFMEWFGNKAYNLIAEHGGWMRLKTGNWVERKAAHTEWKENLIPVLESYVDRTPGSLIEEKTHALVWHYRRADIELGALRALELKADVSNIILNQDLEILEGNKVIEVKISGINKGSAATEFLAGKDYDFIMAIGDDWTDEFLFKELPKKSITIKVGTDSSVAKYYLDSYKEVRQLLRALSSQ